VTPETLTMLWEPIMVASSASYSPTRMASTGCMRAATMAG
jgi:hypothetical protein